MSTEEEQKKIIELIKDYKLNGYGDECFIFNIFFFE